MFCKNCGREQKNNERFCAQCGTPYATIGNNTVPPIPSISNGMNVATSPMNNTGVQQQTSAAHLFISREGEKRCPNCGANYTNTQNCEYCGSLLVRFVENHIEIDEKKYGSTAEKIKGLEDALKENLHEQEKHEGHHITTRMDCESIGASILICNPAAITDFVELKLHGKIFKTYPVANIDDKSNSLQVCFRFVNITGFSINRKMLSKKQALEINSRDKERFDRFYEMDEFSLFELYEEDLYSVDGEKVGTLQSYYIDFGNDYQGAASIITQFVKQVMKLKVIKRNDIRFTQSSMTDYEYNMNLKKMVGKMKRSFITQICSLMLFSIFFPAFCIVIGYSGPVLLYTVIGGPIATIVLYLRYKAWKNRNSVLFSLTK